MPWSSMKDVPFSIRALASIAGGASKVPLTLKQANEIGRMYDGLKGKPGIENPMAIAITNFRKMYHIEDGRWMRRKEENKESTIIYTGRCGVHVFF